MKKKAKINMLTIIALIGAVPMLVATIIMSVLAVRELEEELGESVYERLEVAAIGLQQYYEWDIVNGDGAVYEHDYVDSLKSQEIELTLFLDDVRFITSIKNDKGERNEGTTADSAIYASVKAGNKYFADGVTISGSKYYVCYVPVADGDGKVVGMAFAGEPQKAVEESIASLVQTIVIIAVIVAALFMAIIIFMAFKIKKPTVEVANSIEAVAKGKLDIEVNTTSFVKEIEQLAGSARTLVEELGGTVNGVKSGSNNLANAVAMVDDLSVSSADGAFQINTAVGELATGAVSMAESVQDVNAQVITMDQNIQEITVNVDALTESSDQIKKANDEAKQYMDTVYASSNESVEAVNAISTQILDTNTSINKINDAIVLILSIASQTQLLSLNASIEAARAGDAGRGFAVVAESIQQLAEQSQSSANTIKEIANDIIQKSEASVERSEQIKKIISKEQDYIQETQNKFVVLNDEIQKSLVEIEGIKSKTDSLVAVKEGIVANVSDLSAISEENAASNEEVTASVENIAAAIEEIKNKSGDLGQLSQHLEQLVAYFEV